MLDFGWEGGGDVGFWRRKVWVPSIHSPLPLRLGGFARDHLEGFVAKFLLVIAVVFEKLDWSHLPATIP